MELWLNRALWVAAVIPPLILLGYIYKKDKVEKEPPQLLALLALGGALAVLPALILERLGLSLASRLLPSGSIGYAAFVCFVVVALVEEGCKLFFLKRISWRHPDFNYRFDAIVYAVFVSMGFALVENLFYVAGDGTFATAIVRALTAIPGHAAFSVFMGYYYGTAKTYQSAAELSQNPTRAAACRRLSQKQLRQALLVPVLLHGLYDFLLSLGYVWMQAVFVIFLAWLDFNAIRKIRTATQRDAPVA